MSGKIDTAGGKGNKQNTEPLICEHKIADEMETDTSVRIGRQFSILMMSLTLSVLLRFNNLLLFKHY